MDPTHPTKTPDGAARSREARRRQLIAGGVAVVLTAVTAVVAIGVNFGAADAHVNSTAGLADQIVLPARSAPSTPPTASTSDPWGRPARTSDDDEHEQDKVHDQHEREEHERGHDDDD